MSRPITLVYAATPRYGGWVTFTAHLAGMLASAGHRVRVVKIGNRTEQRTRPFYGRVRYQNIEVPTLRALAAQGGMLIVAADQSRPADVMTLAGAGARIVIHDTAELVKQGNAYARVAAGVVVIRETMLAPVRQHTQAVTFCRHPYLPTPGTAGEPRFHAVSYARIDFDKHTDWIVEANATLPREQRCAIFGALNRLYAFHKIAPQQPGWERDYYGEFAPDPAAGVHVARQGSMVVDLSAISGDGGGTQYTFLEAWNATRPLIVNRAWLDGVTVGAVLQDGVNCLAVGSADELHERLRDGIDAKTRARLVAGGTATLQAHASPDRAAEWARAIGVSEGA